MNSVEYFRSRFDAATAEMQALIDGCSADGVTRDMTPEEAEKFTALQGKVEVARSSLEKAQTTAAAPAATVERSWVGDRIGEAPAVHVKGKHKYSLSRAFSIANGSNRTGLEYEVSRALAEKGRGFLNPDGFFISLGADPEIRALMGYSVERANPTTVLTPTSGAGTVFQSMETPLIDYLRPKLLTTRLPVEWHEGVHGNIAFPRQTSTSQPQATTSGMSSPVTSVTATFDKVELTPHAVTAISTVDLSFTYQSAVQADDLLKRDQTKRMATNIDEYVFAKLLADTGVQANSAGLALGGNYPDWDTVLDMEGAVAIQNAEANRMAYLTNTNVRRRLKGTPKIGTTFPEFVWENRTNPSADGTINERDAFVSNVLGSANTITTATGQGVTSGLSTLIYGNWEMLHVALWDAVEVIEDKITLAGYGQNRYIMRMGLDSAVEHPEGFAILTDVRTA